jgi:predicted  nucleic acid-binding Zn-ribbon protein
MNLQLTKQQSKIESLQQEVVFKENQLNDLHAQIQSNTAQLTEASAAIVESRTQLAQIAEELVNLVKTKEEEELKLNEADQAYYNLRNELQEKESALRTQIKSKELVDQIINEIKDKLNNLKQQNNIYSPSDELSAYLSQIQALEIQRQEIEYQLDELRNLKENTSQNISIVQLSKIEKGSNISNLSQKVLQRNMLLLDYKSDHPSIKALNNQIEHSTREVKQFLYQNIKDNELKLQRFRMQVGQIKSKVNDVSDLSSQYAQFEKESSLKEKFIFGLVILPFIQEKVTLLRNIYFI